MRLFGNVEVDNEMGLADAANATTISTRVK